MKLAQFVLVLLGTTLTASAADTAYNALRVVGKKNGSEALNRVVELRGRNGAPEPSVWKVILTEPKARGGVREVEVQRGQVIAERTPTSRSLAAPMNFNQLNLDSEGVFTIANKEAEKAGLAFDHVDYLLKSGTGGGAPVWQVQLINGGKGTVATIQIAADSGTVLHEEGLNVRTPAPGEDDRSYVDQPTERREETSREREHIRDVPSFFRRVGKHFERRGYQIKNFFTGE